MRIENWVRFILLSVSLLVIVLVIIYNNEIRNAIKVFPLDWIISFLLGAGVMFLANFEWKRKQKNS